MKRITCWKCSYTWIYKGDRSYTACPKCKTTIQFSYKYPFGKGHKLAKVVDL